jgi:hypothetical protein
MARALADELATTVRGFLDGLDDGQRGLAALPFAGGVGGPGGAADERHTWAYWPTERRGVPLHALSRAGTKAALRALAVVLPMPAFARVTAIMGLDEVLDRDEGWASDRRHRDDYWVTVFGTPGDEPWALRFEGHHVSVHATVAGGAVALTPLFLGANPAVVHDGGRVVSAPLAPEEALGFELLAALTVEQRSSVLLSERAPRDIASRTDAHVRADLLDLADRGVPLAALAGPAAAAADALVALYLGRFPAGARVPDPSDARFAWAGADEPGVGHYYRLAGPGLLVELDNTQNEANHVHTVVRDPAADFGDDVLAAHHRHAHG